MAPCHLPPILFWVYKEIIILILEVEDRFAGSMELARFKATRGTHYLVYHLRPPFSLIASL